MPLIGTILIWVALFSAAASIALHATGRSPRMAKATFFLAAACVFLAAAVLQILLQTHRFDIAYVYHYSARALPRQYLFATFWAGQEGSFLLWAFWIAALGLRLIKTSNPSVPRGPMTIYTSVLLFLLLLLVVKSPFVLRLGETATDGMGLQPLLENPWMVIHPPTLFLGFAATVIPFAFALSSLLRGPETRWYAPIWGCSLAGFGILGFGVMLGGYWAYETLGWGGFWGWDPVENGPLVPWLLLGAFVHSVQVDRARGALRKTTLLLGLLPFLTTLYETFLTRTGVLDKFSNHSFSTLGGIANSVILWGMLGAFAVSIALLAFRSREIPGGDVWERASSREFGLTMALLLMAACAAVTGVGMSAPLITQAAVKLGWMTHQATVQADYYNKANFPIAVLLGMGMAIGPYLEWRETGSKRFAELQIPWAASVVVTVLAFFATVSLGAGKFTAPLLLLFASSTFALVASARLLAPRLRASTARLTAGGLLAHIGAALFLLGVVSLVCLQRVEDIDLVENHPAALRTLPYTLTYAGETSNLHDPSNALRLAAESTGGPGEAFSISMPCAIRRQETTPVLLARPAIRHFWWGDLYFALKAGPEQVSPTPLIRFSLSKGQSRTVDGYTYTFKAFSVPPDVAEDVRRGIMPARFPVAADVDVRLPGGRTVSATPQNIRDRDDPLGPSTPEFRLPRPSLGTWWGLTFSSMDANSGQASFFVRDLSEAPLTRYTIEVSTRPLIWLIWLGTVVMTLGILIAARRRFRVRWA